eukprot:scaffold81783_cov74-Phaeocystis_antarctica.AAC.5
MSFRNELAMSYSLIMRLIVQQVRLSPLSLSHHATTLALHHLGHELAEAATTWHEVPRPCHEEQLAVHLAVVKLTPHDSLVSEHREAARLEPSCEQRDVTGLRCARPSRELAHEDGAASSIGQVAQRALKVAARLNHLLTDCRPPSGAVGPAAAPQLLSAMRNAIASTEGRSAATEYVTGTDVEDASGTGGARRAARHFAVL